MLYRLPASGMPAPGLVEDGLRVLPLFWRFVQTLKSRKQHVVTRNIEITHGYLPPKEWMAFLFQCPSLNIDLG